MSSDNRTTRDIGIACLIGGASLVLLSLLLVPTLWWLALPAGSAIGYFSYRFKITRAATDISWQRFKSATDWAQFLTDLSDVLGFLFKATIYLCGIMLLGWIAASLLIGGIVTLDDPTKAMPFVQSLASPKPWTELLHAGFGWKITFSMVCLFASGFVFLLSGYSMTRTYRKRGLFINHLTNPVNEDKLPVASLPFYKYLLHAYAYVLFGWLLWDVLPFLGKVLWLLCKGIGNMLVTLWQILNFVFTRLPVLLLSITKATPRLIWDIFRFVHTRERLVVAIDSCLGGGGVAWWLHSQSHALPLWQNAVAIALGGIASAGLGLINYQLIGVRWLKTLPSDQRQSEI